MGVSCGSSEELIQAGYFAALNSFDTEVRHLDEFVLFAGLLRAMAKTWQAVMGALAWDDALRAWEAPAEFLASVDDGADRDSRAEGAVTLTCDLLNEALGAFTAHVSLHSDRATGRREPHWHATTWQALSLQIFNDIASGSQFKTCANEKCGRIFVRQRGTSRFGQSRATGVMYCTPSCARAQAQREYRRRKKTGDAT